MRVENPIFNDMRLSSSSMLLVQVDYFLLVSVFSFESPSRDLVAIVSGP